MLLLVFVHVLMRHLQRTSSVHNRCHIQMHVTVETVTYAYFSTSQSCFHVHLCIITRDKISEYFGHQTTLYSMEEVNNYQHAL